MSDRDGGHFIEATSFVPQGVQFGAMPLENISDIAAFVRVVETRSFTVAARYLGMSRSAVGKCVVRLENQLGVRLLNRTTRSVSVTDEGEAFYARCVPVLAALEDAELAMVSRLERPRGRLRLDLPVAFGRLHVLPLLQRFMDAWPEVEVNVSFTDRYVDLIEEGIDLAIRVGGEDDSRLIARVLAPHRFVLCATPAYLAEHGRPATPSELREHSCLTFTHAGRPTKWRLRSEKPPTGSGVAKTGQPLQARSRFCASSGEALRDAVLASYGIAQLSTFLVGDDLRSGRLQTVLDTYVMDGGLIRAVYPTSRHLAPRVRRFVDLLVETWRPEPPWDCGI